MNTEKSKWIPVLHFHLPFVRHPEMSKYLEEEWYFEAVTETYLPLLEAFDNLERDNIDYNITISLTPTLLTMMADNLLSERLINYVNARVKVLDEEAFRTQTDPEFHPVTLFYRERYKNLAGKLNRGGGQYIINELLKHNKIGHINIITSAATHSFLLFMVGEPETIAAQIQVGIETHEKLLGIKPSGIWLPECGYTSGFDAILNRYGIFYTFLDQHGIEMAYPEPPNGCFSPVVTPFGVAAFGRDPESSRQVWSSKEGYPGAPIYREFYRDVGFDLDLPHLIPLRHGSIKTFTGLKYYAITGTGNYKEAYRPGAAKRKASEHAEQFVYNRALQGNYLKNVIGEPPVIVSMYDAELFGHWWFEGPWWLESVFRQLNKNSSIESAAAEDISKEALSNVKSKNGILYSPEEKTWIAQPATSTWGGGGYSEVWLNGKNDEIQQFLSDIAIELIDICKNRYNEVIYNDALNQAARELMLAESSDWTFLLSTGQAVSYAERRVKAHLVRARKCISMAIGSEPFDKKWFKDISYKDNIFPWINAKELYGKDIC
ncbi:MAG: DUF1957 domain-containing protein [Deltaproteobacteria bacterium]|nr:DUF1957 domain-containing protein [Deltaproteobacteria bacterium]